jgi:hypothetical protein
MDDIPERGASGEQPLELVAEGDGEFGRDGLSPLAVGGIKDGAELLLQRLARRGGEPTGGDRIGEDRDVGGDGFRPDASM